MARVAVTGASGFVGRQVLKHLAVAGHEPVALVRNPAKPGERPFDLDMTVDQLSVALSDCDHVIHLAARVHMMDDVADAGAFAAYDLANTEPTRRLAQAAAKSHIRQFVFVSTAKVYGEVSPKNRPFRADDVTNPKGPYASSKRHAELALCEQASGAGFSYTIIRPPLVYGPGVKANFAALARLAGTPLALPFGGISNRRSLVSVGNLCSLIVDVVGNPGAYNIILNVSDNHDLSTSGLLRILAKAQRRPQLLLPVPQGVIETALGLLRRRAIADRLCGNFQLSVAETIGALNWKPPETPDEAINGMYQHEVV
jgi:nucleoside-diphosphate-sugar epimerase